MSAVKAALEELGVEDVPLIAIAKGPHHGRDGREVFHFPMGARKCCRSIRPSCSICNACAMRCTASSSARIVKSAAGRSRPVRWMKSRHRSGPQTRSVAAFRHGQSGSRRLAGGFGANARSVRGGGADGL
jgi:hypothetical protein